MFSRRALMTAVAGTAAATALDSVAIAASRKTKRFGVQLYSMREAAKTDPIGTLKRLKKLGYSEVELGGPPYSTMDPKELRRELVRIGLTAPSMHVQMDELENNMARVLSQGRMLGCQYIVLPWINEDRRSNISQCQQTAKAFNHFGKMVKDAGFTFAYHNHSFEFEPVEGKLPFDILFGESDPDLVKIELDLLWATKGKADIPAIFRKHAGRIPLCHVKDMTAAGDMTNVGSGVIDFQSIFDMSKLAGLKHYFVEHDNPPPPYWPSMEASARQMQKLRY